MEARRSRAPFERPRGRCSQNRWTRRSKTRHAALRIPVLLTQRRNAARVELLEQAKTEGVSELHVPGHLVGTATIPLLGAGKTDYAAAQALVEKELNVPKDRPGEGPAG